MGDMENILALSDITPLLKRHEGLKLDMYVCPAGRRTIGYGHNLDMVPITERAAEIILEDDIAMVLWQMGQIPRLAGILKTISPARRAVLISMAFNLGVAGLLGFRNMLNAMERGNFDWASQEMLSSRWASQVGARARELARMMREG